MENPRLKKQRIRNQSARNLKKQKIALRRNAKSKNREKSERVQYLEKRGTSFFARRISLIGDIVITKTNQKIPIQIFSQKGNPGKCIKIWASTDAPDIYQKFDKIQKEDWILYASDGIPDGTPIIKKCFEILEEYTIVTAKIFRGKLL
jgi:hypothetical protein